MELPHRFPFRFVEPQGDASSSAGDDGAERSLRLRLTGGDRWLGRDGELPETLAIELMAQACFHLVPPEAVDRARLALAGIETARFERRARVGEELVARGELVARFGALVRVRGRLEAAAGEPIAEAELLLAARER